MIHPMKATLNVTVEQELANYLEHYQTTHRLKSRSEAVSSAIRALRRSELERDAREAAQDPEQAADAAWWGFTGKDGLGG
jgi:antitoxin ParD1/3/4